MAEQKIEQSLLCLICKFTVCITPFAVILIQKAVLFPADAVIRKRHAAALADQLPRRAEKRIDRHVKERGKQLERFDIRRGFARFPAGYRLSGDKNFAASSSCERPFRF